MRDDQDLSLSKEALARMLPMHVWLSAEGRVLSVGATLLKVIPDLAQGVSGRMTDARAEPGCDVIACIRAATHHATRLFLRVETCPEMVLRGHSVPAGGGSMLLDLGFGIAINRAIAAGELTDSDFSPTDLVMEFLFLHEANRGVLSELARFNSQLAKARRAALSEAHSDALTGLTNRRGLQLALASLLRPAEQGQFGATPQPFALVHLDLDHFKEVNDRLGHKAGDDLLRRVGEVLRLAVRRADTAARIGGDEFVLILRGFTCPVQLAQLAQRLIDSIRAASPPELGGREVSASLGVVVWRPESQMDAEALMELSDKALYRSKRAGRAQAMIIEKADDIS